MGFHNRGTFKIEIYYAFITADFQHATMKYVFLFISGNMNYLFKSCKVFIAR